MVVVVRKLLLILAHYITIRYHLYIYLVVKSVYCVQNNIKYAQTLLVYARGRFVAVSFLILMLTGTFIDSKHHVRFGNHEGV